MVGSRFDLQGPDPGEERNGFDNQSGFLKGGSQDPMPEYDKTHRGAVGLWPRRLSGRGIPARVGGVER